MCVLCVLCVRRCSASPRACLFVTARRAPTVFCCGAPGRQHAAHLTSQTPPNLSLQPYFKSLYSSLRVGPPLYFVVERLNVSDGAGDANAVCSVSGCRKDSLTTRVRGAPPYCHVPPWFAVANVVPASCREGACLKKISNGPSMTNRSRTALSPETRFIASTRRQLAHPLHP